MNGRDFRLKCPRRWYSFHWLFQVVSPLHLRMHHIGPDGVPLVVNDCHSIGRAIVDSVQQEEMIKKSNDLENEPNHTF